MIENQDVNNKDSCACVKIPVLTFDNYDGGRVRLVVVPLRDAGQPVLARLGDGRILL